MLSVIILICSLSTEPHSCDGSNALATYQGGRAGSIMSCGRDAQVFLSRSAFKPDPSREYAKIQCVPNQP